MLVSKIKEQLYNLLLSLNYNATDKGIYEEKFPWLMVRTNTYRRADSFDLRHDRIILTIDIFSKYSGEKEVLEIIENISNNIHTLKNENEAIMYIEQIGCVILDDNSTGPVRKHAVLSYEFTCVSGLEEESDE